MVCALKLILVTVCISLLPIGDLYAKNVSADCVIIASANEEFYQLAVEIRDILGGDLFSLSRGENDLLRHLRQTTPSFAVVVVPRSEMTLKLTRSLFRIFCSVDEDVLLDIGFGYITGRDSEQAREFFYRSRLDSLKKASLTIATHRYPGDELVQNVVDHYASKLKGTGWNYKEIVLSDSLPYPNRVHEFDENQLMFLIGHGSEQWICGLHASVFNGVSLRHCIVLSGACQTGKIDDGTIAQTMIDQGVTAYLGGIDDNFWFLQSFIAKEMTIAPLSIGETCRRGINNALEFAKIDEIRFREVTKPSVNSPLSASIFETEWWRQMLLNHIGGLVLYGDPTFQPQFDSELDLSIGVNLFLNE